MFCKHYSPYIFAKKFSQQYTPDIQFITEKRVENEYTSSSLRGFKCTHNILFEFSCLVLLRKKNESIILIIMLHFKKLMMCATIMLSAFTTVSAQNAMMDWSLCPQPSSAYNSISLPAFFGASFMDVFEVDGLRNYAAVRLDADTASKYAGCQLKSIKVTSGVYSTDISDKTIRLSISESLDGEPLYTTEYTPVGSEVDYSTWQITWNRDVINIPDDVVINLEKGKELYAILEYTEQSDLDYEYVVFLSEAGASSPEGSYLSALEGTVYVNGEPRTFTKEWSDVSQELTCGPLSLSFTLSGAGLEQNSVEITSLQAPYHIRPGEMFDVTAEIRNVAGNAVTSVTATCDVDGTITERTFEVNEMYYDTTTTITFDGLTYDSESIIPVTVTVTGVNGDVNHAPDGTSATTSINCLTDGYARNVVIEEGTGMWCGWCVRGIVAMEDMNEMYGDGTFIGMAIHDGDDMQALDCGHVIKLIDEWVGGFPGIIVNRTYGADVTTARMKNAYETSRLEVVPAKIELTATINGDDIDVTSVSTFSVDDNSTDYRVGYAVLEDNVGPYLQQNYYSGGGNGPMGGFEDMDKAVYLLYNDVVRSYYGCEGLPGSLPTSVEKDGTYSHTCSIPMTGVVNPNNVSVVAMIINATNGSIVNAVKVSNIEAGVVPVFNDRQCVTVSGRCVSVAANGTYTRIYTPDGRLAASVNPGNAVWLQPGIYVIATGHSTDKIVIR